MSLVDFVAIGAVSWLDIARIVRGQTLSLKQREFVEAARVPGCATLHDFRHIVPNLIGIVMIYATLTIPTVILFEAFLSFWDWACIRRWHRWARWCRWRTRCTQSPFAVCARHLTGVMICCFSYLGDGLRDALDPRERR